MTVTYKTTPNWPGIKFPVLHKVVYAHTIDGVAAQYQNSYKDYLIRKWCEDNCKGRFYLHPGWTTEKFVQFEDEQDAVLFALKWL
jgi:hypothetical protein